MLPSTPHRTPTAPGEPNHGPLLRFSTTSMSRVNHDCRPYLTLIEPETVERLGLRLRVPRATWALMTLRTSDTSEWSFYVNYSPESHFQENIISVPQALTRGAVICARDASPNIRLSGRVFALLRRPVPGRVEVFASLCLQLPLEPAGSSVAVLGPTTFLPTTHRLHYMTMNRSVASEIIELAGLTQGHMERYVAKHSDAEGELPPWLLADLTRVSHPTHLAYTLDLAMRDDLSTGDNSETRNHFAEDMTVTTLFHGAPLPRVWASMPGTGTVPGHEHGVQHELTQSPRDVALRSLCSTPRHGWSTMWWVRAWGFVDNAASR